MVSRRREAENHVFIVGGGPGGLAAALALRQRGFEVTVADGCTPPVDKPCGEGLMPDGIDALAQLGIRIPEIEAHPFRGIRFVSGDISVEARFPRGYGLGARRTNLHRVMVERAGRAGVRLCWGAVVTGLHADGVLVRGKLVRARWIVGADGSGSRVRRWAGLDSHLRKKERFAFRRHYRVAPWSEFMELHWGSRCQVYVTPVDQSQICVVLISRDPALRLDEALRQFPGLFEQMRGAEHGSGERGAVTITRKLARVCSDRVALLGDASGGVDAITGEGLCLTFRQANLLADCLSEGALQRYQAGHRSLSRHAAMMAELMLLLERHNGLRLRAMRAFRNRPNLFARMLAMHVGAASPLDVAGNGLALGWSLLTA
jgi:2-polyprenyl-6-methoxyphenol hydroxylase-like FAD-dependent oxidoreductase